MKKFLISFLTVVIGGAVIMILFVSLAKQDGPRYVYKGNSQQKPIAFKPKEYQCSECNMDVEYMEYAAQIITKDGITYFFDDIGCVVLWLKNRELDGSLIFTQTLDTHRWIDANRAWYTRTASSPMGYGLAAYEEPKEKFVSYEDMRLLMLQGKTLHDPFVKKSLLSQ
ncbi:MAG: hypothetical protein U9R27_10410 [Campylobacterota bacterium]|nr:hypothetical protein [Campylobacterota bacterium]